jgi:alpha-tubulin suppressor-like RCC1 family protein
VWCWGDNGNGNLGDGSFLNQNHPVQAVLGAGAGATMIAAGGATTCAALSDDSLKCWGKGNSGQIGNNAKLLSNGTPAYVSSVPALFPVAHLEIGGAHTCAISALGAAWCWGQFASGRLGTSVQSVALNPSATASLGGLASTIAAGGAHTCVLLVIGSVTCFGSNSTGQIGLTPGTSPNPTPTVVTLETTATSVSAGEEFTCVLLSTAGVHCFGDNTVGQLGSGSIGSARETPGVVTGLTGTVVDVTAGASHACAVMSTGQVRCWGLNDQGQLGIGSKVTATAAIAITSLNVVPTTTTTAVPTVEAPVTVTTITTKPISTATSISTSTNTTSTTTPTEPTTSTVALTKVAVPKVTALIHPIAMRRGSKMSAAKVAASVSMKIPRRSVGTMRISITKGKQYCAFAGTSLKAVRKGKCTIVVIYLPKRGPSVLRSNTLTVRK